MKVKELMSQPIQVVPENVTLETVARTMLAHHIGCVPVVDVQGKLTGIITESDFAAKEKGIPFSTFRAPQVLGQWLDQNGVARIYQASRTLQAHEIMQPRVATVTEDNSVQDAVELLLKHDVTRLPVVRDGVPVGIVSRHDLLRLMVRAITEGEKA